MRRVCNKRKSQIVKDNHKKKPSTCLIAAVHSVLPQLQLQVTRCRVEVAAEAGGLQLRLQLLLLLLVLQLISAGLQVPAGVKGLFYCLDLQDSGLLMEMITVGPLLHQQLFKFV